MKAVNFLSIFDEEFETRGTPSENPFNVFLWTFETTNLDEAGFICEYYKK